MVLIIKSTAAAASILLLFLSAALLSTARLHPTGVDEVNGISSTKASVETTNNNKEKNIAAIDLKKHSVNYSPISSFHGKRSLSDEFVAFTADYHPPRHHPPKNNK